MTSSTTDESIVRTSEEFNVASPDGDLHSDKAEGNSLTDEPADRRTEGVNRFLLCTLVSKSSRGLKRRAQADGRNFPAPLLVRSVLRRYLSVAVDTPALFSLTTGNMARVRKINEEIFSETIVEQAAELVSAGRIRLAQAVRHCDRARIEAETEHLKSAIEAHELTVNQERTRTQRSVHA